MADKTSFNVDSANYLGLDNDVYQAEILELALTRPSDYFKLRKHILQQVKKLAVENQYNIYYNLLVNGSGTKPDGTPKVDTFSQEARITTDGALYRPQMPKQKVNEFSLAVAKTTSEIAEKAIEMILPLNYKEIAQTCMADKTKGDLGFEK